MKGITLKEADLTYLEAYKRDGKKSMREFNSVNILLLLHKGKKSAEIEEFLNVDRITIWRTKKKYLESGVELALQEDQLPGQPIKYTTDHHGELSAMHVDHAPKAGSDGGTLVDKRVKEKAGIRKDKPRICTAGVKKNECKPWLKRMWCIQEITQRSIEQECTAVGQVKSVDFFINDIPFNLKVTYLPSEYIKEKRAEKGHPVELTFLKAKEANIYFDKNAKPNYITYEIVEKMKDKGDEFCLGILQQ